MEVAGVEASGRPRAFVGRDVELACLASALEGTTHGSGRVVVIEGEAGIGKSALVGEALSQLEARRFQVLRAGAEEMESHRPFGVLADAFGLHLGQEGLRSEVGALLFGRHPAGETPQTLAFRVGELIVALMEELVASGPMVVVVEDLHWADPATLAILYRLARALPQLACTLVCTTRPLPRRTELEQLLGALAERRATRIEVGSLGEQATDDLVEALVGTKPGPGLAAQARKAGGNPLYLTELVGALAAEGSIDRGPDGRAEARMPNRSPSLSVLILRQLSVLGSQVKEVLGLAAILGVHFSVDDLSVISGLSVVALSPILRESLRAGVLEEAQGRLCFRHELIRDALYADIPPALRGGLHREAARALANVGSAATKVAEHLLRGADPGDPQAVAWLDKAAREAGPKDPTVAVELWARALDLAGPGDPCLPEARAGLALGLMATGRTAEGEPLCRRVLGAGAPPGQEWVLRTTLIQSLLVQGRLPEAWAEIDRALASGKLSGSERARLLAWASQVHFFGGNRKAAVEAAHRAEAAGIQADDAPTLIRAWLTLAHLAYSGGRLGEALELAARAVDLTESDGSVPAYEGQAHAMYAVVLAEADAMDEADRVAMSGRRAADSLGSGVGLLLSHVAAAARCFFSGHWDGTSTELEMAATLAEGTGTAWSTEFLCMEAMVGLHRRGPRAAEGPLGRAEAALVGGGHEFRLGWVARTRATCLAAQGQMARAQELQWGAWQACQVAGAAIEYRLLGPELVTLAVVSGEDALADQVASEVEAVAALNPKVASLQGAAERARGLAERDPDRLLAALTTYRQSPRRPERAATATDAAMALARTGRRKEALAVADEALGLWEEMGATWEASRARGDLRQAGLSLGSRGRRGRPATGWDALSPTEAKVAALVASGASNPEVGRQMFISRRTVESHVSHVLAKLGVSSRTEMAAAAARRGAVHQIGQEPQQA